jgi:hypothetical protein
MDVLPAVLRCCTLRPTAQVRLGSNTLGLTGGTPIFTVSRQQFMKHQGFATFQSKLDGKARQVEGSESQKTCPGASRL